MCKLGDIIIIKEFKNENNEIVSKHSFVVISDEGNYIEGFKYDFIANMLCSFHNKNHKYNKLKYKQNLAIKEKIIAKSTNKKEGFIKADQLYYFCKDKIEYKIIAKVSDDVLNELIQLIEYLNDKKLLKPIYTNIK